MKNIKFVVLAIAALALCACSSEVNQNRWIKRIVTKEKLKNGKYIKVGYQAPHGDWGCVRMHRDEFNWRLNQMEGGFTNLGGGYGRLRDKAIDYTNDNPKLGINYAYLYIPNEDSVLGVNYTFMRKASVDLYKCKITPKENHDPFNDKVNKK